MQRDVYVPSCMTPSTFNIQHIYLVVGLYSTHASTASGGGVIFDFIPAYLGSNTFSSCSCSVFLLLLPPSCDLFFSIWNHMYPHSIGLKLGPRPRLDDLCHVCMMASLPLVVSFSLESMQYTNAKQPLRPCVPPRGVKLRRATTSHSARVITEPLRETM